MTNGHGLTIAYIHCYCEGKLYCDHGPNHPTQSLGSSERVDQRKRKHHRNAGNHRDRVNSLGTEPIMQISKKEDLDQSVHYAIDGKNISNAGRIKTKAPEFYWCCKEDRLYGPECDFDQREGCIVSRCDKYTRYQERAQRQWSVIFLPRFRRIPILRCFR